MALLETLWPGTEPTVVVLALVIRIGFVAFGLKFGFVVMLVFAVVGLAGRGIALLLLLVLLLFLPLFSLLFLLLFILSNSASSSLLSNWAKNSIKFESSK